EMLWHTYDIQRDGDGTFSLLFDGQVLRSGISAGPPSAWADGIGTGTLFTQSTLNDRHLSTFFDNVRVLGLAGAPPAGTGSGQGPLMATGIPSAAFADFGLGSGTTDFHPVTAVQPARESGPSNEVSATEQAMVGGPGAPAERSASAGDGQARGSRTH